MDYDGNLLVSDRRISAVYKIDRERGGAIWPLGGRKSVYVSWNGATQVATWEVLAGPGSEGLEPVGSVPRKGFETAISSTTEEPHVAARAKDRSGRVLGTSEAVKRGS